MARWNAALRGTDMQNANAIPDQKDISVAYSNQIQLPLSLPPAASITVDLQIAPTCAGKYSINLDHPTQTPAPLTARLGRRYAVQRAGVRVHHLLDLAVFGAPQRRCLPPRRPQAYFSVPSSSRRVKPTGDLRCDARERVLRVLQSSGQ